MSKTYLQFVNEDISTDHGLYSFRKPSLHSLEILNQWIQENQIPNPISPAELHATVVCSETAVPTYTPDPKSIWINPATYSIAILGEALVLRFRSEVLSRQWEQAKAMGAQSRWPTYQPHLSLSYSIPEDFDYSEIKPLPVQIILGEELIRPMIDGWAAINHLTEDMTLGGPDVLNVTPIEIPQIRDTDISEFVTWIERQGIEVTIPTNILTKPVISSNDNYILDEHLRCQSRDPHFMLETYQVDLPIRELLAIAHGFPKAFYKQLAA